MIEILTHPASWKETNKLFSLLITSHNHWGDSGTYGGSSASCCWRQTGTAGAVQRSISSNRRVAATFPCTDSPITVFGPVTWLCRLKCWIFLDSHTHGSPPRRSLDNRLLSQDNHSFKAQCQTESIKCTWWSGRSLWSGPRLGYVAFLCPAVTGEPVIHPVCFNPNKLKRVERITSCVSEYVWVERHSPK